MRVTVTEAFTAYINHQPEQFTQGQQVKGNAAVYLLGTGAPVEPADDDAKALAGGKEPAGALEFDADGTAAQILGWVGDDTVRAVMALEAEQAKGDAARSTLVKSLEKIAAS